jgi:glycosyltransferase involved in cell wall biosynthesis
MRVALVASSYRPPAGGLERHVDELARGLALRGVDVEVLAQCRPRGLARLSKSNGFILRPFVAPQGDTRSPVAPGLWAYLRRTVRSFDLVHAHTREAPLALAVLRASPRRMVFTPHAGVRHMVRWPYARVMRAVIDNAAQTICISHAERDLLRGRFPEAADRIGVVPTGVDVAAIEAARPFGHPGRVVLTAGPLQRYMRVDRAIAAMASLDPAFSLVVIGEGPARHKLLAHAADLHVSSRVRLLGAIPDAQLYRWLQTARVFVTLAEHHPSGRQVVEGLTAGTAVVASDTPVHREAASYGDGAGVLFVSPEGSPLEVSDAISRASEMVVHSTAPMSIPRWSDVVDGTLTLYEALVRRGPPPDATGGVGSESRRVADRRNAPDVGARG